MKKQLVWDVSWCVSVMMHSVCDIQRALMILKPSIYDVFWMFVDRLGIISNMTDAFNTIISVTWQWKWLNSTEKLYAQHLRAICDYNSPESSLTSLQILLTYQIFGEQTCICACKGLVWVNVHVLPDPPPPSSGPSPWQPDYVSCYPIRARLHCCVPCNCCLFA